METIKNDLKPIVLYLTLLVNGSHIGNPKDHWVVNLKKMLPGNISLNSRHSLSLSVFFFSFKAPIASIVSLNAVYQLLFGLESKDKNAVPGETRGVGLHQALCFIFSILFKDCSAYFVLQTPENT